MTESIARERPLGEAQRSVLANLTTHRGIWHRGCGWRWETDAWTIKLLDSLALSDLVEPVTMAGKRDAYKLTRKGRTTARALALNTYTIAD